MSGNLTFPKLQQAFKDGAIDTVIVAMVDMQGRLMGKRFHAANFIETAHTQTHTCNYLLATDYAMATVAGYAATSWSQGYGDYTMKPDMATLRYVPWLEKTALVLCDTYDHHGNKPIEHAPRTMLKQQIKRLQAMGMQAKMASELEFFLFQQSYEQALQQSYLSMEFMSGQNEDYHVFQTSKEEQVMRAIRNGLYGAGIDVECSKGEASAGQEEINVKYDYALIAADNHVIIKNACKEIAWGKGQAVTFMAKWHNGSAGSSSHVHQSLWSPAGEPLFYDADQQYGMSQTMQHYVAGLLQHSSAMTYFLAPNINSYKRFVPGSFAPTQAVWSLDNRTAGYRVCGDSSQGIRIECRVGGSDLNPYLAFAALLAAGIDGMQNNRELGAECSGDAYANSDIAAIPSTLDAAITQLRASNVYRQAFGDAVVDHYCRAGEWEIQQHQQSVTDWEVKRGFEQA